MPFEHSIEHKFAALDILFHRDAPYATVAKAMPFKVALETIKDWAHDTTLLQTWGEKQKSLIPPAFIIRYMKEKDLKIEDIYCEVYGILDLGFETFHLADITFDPFEEGISTDITDQLKLLTLALGAQALYREHKSFIRRPAKVFRFLCARALSVPYHRAISQCGMTFGLASDVRIRAKREGIEGQLYRDFNLASDVAQDIGIAHIHKQVVTSESKSAKNGLSLLERVLRREYSLRTEVEAEVKEVKAKNLTTEELEALLKED